MHWVTSACLAGNLYVLLISGVNLRLLYWLPFLTVLRLAAIRCRTQCKKMREQDGKEVFLTQCLHYLTSCNLLGAEERSRQTTSDKERKVFHKMNERRHISFKYFLLFSFLFLDTGALTRDKKSSSSVQSRSKVSYPRSFIHTQNQHRAPRDYEFYDSTLFIKTNAII